MILTLKIECNDDFIDADTKELIEGVLLAKYDMSLDTDVSTYTDGVLGTLSELSNMGATTYVELSKEDSE